MQSVSDDRIMGALVVNILRYMKCIVSLFDFLIPVGISLI